MQHCAKGARMATEVIDGVHVANMRWADEELNTTDGNPQQQVFHGGRFYDFGFYWSVDGALYGEWNGPYATKTEAVEAGRR